MDFFGENFIVKIYFKNVNPSLSPKKSHTLPYYGCLKIKNIY